MGNAQRRCNQEGKLIDINTSDVVKEGPVEKCPNQKECR